MKLPLTLAFCFVLFCSFAQQKEFQIQGRIVDANQNPIADAYIINYRNLEKNTSRNNGVFDAWVLPGDSLIISHVSYFRRVVPVFQILSNPNIQMTMDTINILQIDVLSDQKTDYERAKDNISSIKESKFPTFIKIDEDPDPVNRMVTEHNRIFRNEASSVSIIRFSPSQGIELIADKIKRRKKGKEFHSTKKKKGKNKKKLPGNPGSF